VADALILNRLFSHLFSDGVVSLLHFVPAVYLPLSSLLAEILCFFICFFET